MSIISLTQQERDKFAFWLEQEAKSDDDMSKQLENLKGNEVMVKRMRQRATIFSIVATELRNIEDISIGGI